MLEKTFLRCRYIVPQVRINKWALSLFVFFPSSPLPEQKKIAEILSTVDERLQLLREKKEDLKKVKKGLMNDLLTGKKRVKI